MPRRQMCTNHCSTCGMHFNGLAAFDLHLHRVNEGKNQWNSPTYDLEHSLGDLELWTSDGYCDLTGDLLHPIPIWRKPLTDADRLRFGKMKLPALVLQ